LPPVQPPSAGLLLQQFVIPGVIVLIIVVVYLGLFQLVNWQTDPRIYVERIERGNEGSWQAASDLADRLRNPSDPAIRQDRLLATALAGLLDRELKSGQVHSNAVLLRIFLCRTLGEFTVDSGLPVLLKAAGPVNNEEQEIRVRYAAIEALALLANNTKDAGGLAHPNLIPTLVKAAGHSSSEVRLRTAFALGLIEDKSGQVTATLVELLRDPNPEPRFNAATALARQGHVACVPVLAEMLDPENLKLPPSVGEQPNDLEWYRALILRNALVATKQLREHNATADLSLLTGPIEQLQNHHVIYVRDAARETLSTLRGTPASTK